MVHLFRFQSRLSRDVFQAVVGTVFLHNQLVGIVVDVQVVRPHHDFLGFAENLGHLLEWNTLGLAQVSSVGGTPVQKDSPPGARRRTECPRRT